MIFFLEAAFIPGFVGFDWFRVSVSFLGFVSSRCYVWRICWNYFCRDFKESRFSLELFSLMLIML